METGMTCCGRGVLQLQPNVVVSQQYSNALAPPRVVSPSFITSKSLKASSLFGESVRMAPRSSLKVSRAARNSSVVTKCEIGDSLRLQF